MKKLTARMNRERGSTTVAIMCVLLFISALFVGTGGFIELSIVGMRHAEQRNKETGRLRDAAGAVVASLLSDNTPFADCPQDPVWTFIAQPRDDGITIELKDISSQMGINGIRKELLTSMDVLRPGVLATDLQQFREDTGIHMALKPAFSRFILDTDLDALFTVYGYFDINTTDEFVLRKLYFARSGDESAAENFHIKVQKARVQRLVLKPDKLAEYLGPDDYSIVFPLVNAEAPLNVHFTPQRILEALFKQYSVPAQYLQPLLNARSSQELTPTDIQSFVHQPNFAQSQVSAYLGTKTWFWNIHVHDDQGDLTWIVARMPRADGVVEFRRVEERMSI